MEKLYIIGNGFDLHHGMRTQYCDFNKFVCKNNNDLEWALQEYYPFELDDRYLWKNFESDLHKFDHEAFFNNYNHLNPMDDDFKRSQCYVLEDKISQEAESLVESIRNIFSEWISKVSCPSRESIRNKLLSISPKSHFINFNYTNTLETLYNISKKNILYIHNNATEHLEELVLGHGEVKELSPAEPEQDMNGDSTRSMFTDAQNAARYPFYEMQKDAKEILNTHGAFFDRLGNVKEIFVLGHSLGKADWTYFKKILVLSGNATWNISFYHEEERIKNMSIAVDNLGIDESQVKIIKMNSLLS